MNLLLVKQTEALEELLRQAQDARNNDRNEKRTSLGSIIKISPTVKWPILDDDNNQVKEFFIEFERVCGLGNEGKGIEYREMIELLPQSLKGHRLTIFKTMQKQHAEGLAKTNPEMLYEMVKSRLLMFHETEPERQARVMSEFDLCVKGNLPALSWEAVFERAVGELESAGLPQSADQLRIKYVQKVGPEMPTSS